LQRAPHLNNEQQRVTPYFEGVADARRGGMGLMAVVHKASTLSAKAQRLGLETRDDVEREFAEAKQGWSKGTEYHCPFCDRDFWSSSGARKHMKTRGHPVLRWDWY
jgi:hypothetical protein